MLDDGRRHAPQGDAVPVDIKRRRVHGIDLRYTPLPTTEIAAQIRIGHTRSHDDRVADGKSRVGHWHHLAGVKRAATGYVKPGTTSWPSSTSLMPSVATGSSDPGRQTSTSRRLGQAIQTSHWRCRAVDMTGAPQ